jgi:hypothetical protein
MAFLPYPKYRVLREGAEGWAPATYEDGEEVWCHGQVPEECAKHITALCIEAAEREPGAVLIAVDPEGVELFRAEPITLSPF